MAGRRERVASAGDLAAGQGRVVQVGGRAVALFNVDGTYYAIDNTCAHRGGPLGEGDLEGHTVVCPWHGWRWDVTTGASANNPALRLGCYAVAVEGDDVYIEVQ
ncbi:MAG TPA: non-heme iron oxygenase ferredoxin subunit [Candidatus Tectomicrobia bacterium]|nr:non-heme iron oxygenase ferredoxin subunit [Candidatus Tectomicrobia bacterium]